MIRRYDFGTPMDTGAVIHPIEAEKGILPRFAVTRESQGLRFTLALGAEDIIFGLGEQVRGINKRGHLYRSWNTDQFNHTENQQSLYASHNLLLFRQSGGVFGVYFDDPGAMTFDLGYTQSNEAAIISENGDVSVYLLEGGSLTALCTEFRGLIGRSYIPPKWAFGYIQSRWGYASDDEVRHIVAEHRSRHIPLDGVCLDIDYMDGYRDFTWNHEAFPNLKQLNDDMRGEHIRLIPIIDAGVKEDPGWDKYEEGVQGGYFCKRADGSDFVGAVWPGRACFPDVLDDQARAWFGDSYRVLMDAGIEGFWNDMNEPALFYTPEGLEEAYQQAEKLHGENLGLDGSFKLKGLFLSLANNPEDYKRFYHRFHGKTVRHDKVHNLYGAYMTKAAAEAFKRYDPDHPKLLFSRSSFIGAHRDGGVWQGDNFSWWSHLLLNLKMTASLNMCGFLYTGADLGGFGCDITEDLLLRWLELGVFTPLMRNHSALHTRDQEAYRFGMQDAMRRVLTVRYALIPYLYSEFMKAALNDGMLFRPLAFDYPADETACRVEDQLMLGHACMIAPVYEQNALGRHVYLPEDMAMIRFRSAEDYDIEHLSAGHHWVDLKLDEFPLFIRRNEIVPLGHGAEWVEAIDTTDLTLLGWLDHDALYSLYDEKRNALQPISAHGDGRRG